MQKQILAPTIAISLLAACGESQEAEPVAETDPLAELAAGTGPYLVTYADGTQSLNFAAADGREYSGPTPGPEHAKWTVSDGLTCLDPPGDAEDGSSNVTCITMGEIAEDGSWTVIPDGSEEGATVRRLDEGPVGEMSVGSYLLDLPDGERALAVWTASGDAYVTFEFEQGTWRSDGSMRCTTYGDGEETCGSPTSEMGEDGNFTAEDGANGTITVTML